MRRLRLQILARWPLLTAAALVPTACQYLPPSMPDYPATSQTIWLDQGWTPNERDRYHLADQGTLTFGIPYQWFVALEQPTVSLAETPLLGDKGYLDRFGFIPGDSVLPVGFARGQGFRDPGTGEVWSNKSTGQPYDGIGLTCAACHTGRMTYRGTELLIDGGAALTDLGGFRKAMGLSLAYTKLLPFRWGRFEARVLGGNASPEAKQELRTHFDAVLTAGKQELDLEQSVAAASQIEGFARLDALNRIGNQVFALDLHEPANYAPETAPVHFPHIWTAPWFTWVQYNGSIMQPMVRNAGEAMGVKAWVNLTTKPLFDSGVRVDTLHWVEGELAGKPPYRAKAFSGLRPPAWPSVLPPIDTRLAAQGAGLYKELCQGCHLPATNTPEFWSGKWWVQIGGKGERYLDLHQIPISEIGTDPEQAAGMARRQVKLPADFPIQEPSFAKALGAVVERVTTRWYDTRRPPTTPAERDVMNGGRPNKLLMPLSYKARPLNGIWATPPYLHNGSVPSLYALLSPRPNPGAMVAIGDREFDPVNVGYRETPIKGGFLLDTSKPGNSNRGHEFRDGPSGDGVIGRGLTETERRALIEYLKTL